MTVFEIIGPIPDGVDRAIATHAATAWRQGDRVHIGVTAAPPAFLRDAALAGLRLRRAAVRPAERQPASLEAHGRDLRPLHCDANTTDRIELRPIPIAEGTRRLLRRRLRFLPPPAGRRDLCRDLLHGIDVEYEVLRVVWCPRAALRDGANRRSLRPVVFDRGAAPPVLRRTARDGDLARWLRG